MSTPNAEHTLQPAPAAARLVTLAQAALEAQVSERTIRDLQRSGRLGLVKIGRSVRVPREALERLIKEGA